MNYYDTENHNNLREIAELCPKLLEANKYLIDSTRELINVIDTGLSRIADVMIEAPQLSEPPKHDPELAKQLTDILEMLNGKLR